ncbi:CaiB/BaiF CoA transferase family protein [Rhabdothermincola sediminis]|uniref:CaiB/BaiF CoA transferase family protein n=1 Tax=Rhabdothermincola sediminis TaxID=2751370 RepID=UPI001AA0953C|nr:CaiB/BaiF CoA-transferase family protein [Rhabdothermincola sediminis]
MAGPLEGIRVVELAGLGPAPFGAMVLADLGADVVVVDRPDHVLGASPETAKGNVYARGRRSIAVDLKRTEGVEVVRTLARAADVLVEGFRPGVMERLGLGPEVLRADNPRLVYARMTGWGRHGPLADRAGHDLNYLGLAGPLAHIGRRGQPPTPPLNLVADFGGGGMLLALGVCAALVERATSGEGQVVDAAMVDGVALLAAPIASAYMLGYFNTERGTNWLDSGAHYYEVYETADGGWLSVGAIEPAFYANLLRGLGLADEDLPDQHDASQWPAMKERFAAVFRTRTRDEWMEVFAELDACVAPVLTFAEAPRHPHLRARSTYVDVEGIVQPAPAPRFDRTPASLGRPPAPAGQHTDEVLAEAGYDPQAIAVLRQQGAVA